MLLAVAQIQTSDLKPVDVQKNNEVNNHIAWLIRLQKWLVPDPEKNRLFYLIPALFTYL